MKILFLISLVLLDFGSAEPLSDPFIVRIKEVMSVVREMHQPMREPQAGDWLAQFKESGQTFDQYLECSPHLPENGKAIIYIQPLGELTKNQDKIVHITRDYMESFFCLSVKILPTKPLKDIPKEGMRIHPVWNDRQILTRYLIENYLKPFIPADAVGMVGITASDLYTEGGLNYVFGSADFWGGTGVWSFYRLGKTEGSEEEFRRCLKRTMKIVSHETGHLFSIKHCILYECNMSGVNNLGEMDRRGLDVCPECMAKVCWAMGVDPLKRYQKLASFCKEKSFDEDGLFFEKAVALVKGSKSATKR